LIWPIIKQRLPVAHAELEVARDCTIGLTKGSRRIRYFDVSTVSTGGSNGLIELRSGTGALVGFTIGVADGIAVEAVFAAIFGAIFWATAGVTFGAIFVVAGAATGAVAEALAGASFALTAFFAAAGVCAAQLAAMHANKISRVALISLTPTASLAP
jgi:hypothetical protein